MSQGNFPSSYANYTQFGKNERHQVTDPLTYCLVDSDDRKFLHGSNAVLYGPRSYPCQAYMAQRCAEKWDGFCEYFYVQHSEKSVWPDTRLWPDTLMANTWGSQVSDLTIGEQLLKNTAMLKYCTFPGCNAVQELFNPLDPASPKITRWVNKETGGNEQCIPVCRVLDRKNVDQDPVMNRMLANPKAAAQTLINICNTSKRMGDNLAGTKIGAFCTRYQKARAMEY